MKIHVLQHVPFEGLGEIGPWLADRRHRLTGTQFFRGDPLPPLEEVDWLIVLGGPMNVYEYRNHPWLREEKQFLERAIAQKKRVLGICLGAQLIADVLGAKVYQNPEKEIGWFPIQVLPGAASFFDGAPSTLAAFHWHGDTFDLPAGAAWLARSEACRHQAFSVGPHVVGLQFHLEMNASGVAALIEHGRSDITPGRFVQGEAQMLQSGLPDPETKAALHRLLEALIKSAHTMSTGPTSECSP